MTTTSHRLFGLTAGCLLWAAAVGAQTTSTAPAQPQSSTPQSSDASTRPATTTFFGDTGLWFVPTAEVLPAGKWSGGGYRRGTNYVQGFSNVGDFAATFGVGVKDRAELFGSFLVDTRIDRDLRPIFINDNAVGGIIDRYPRVDRGWTGDHLGDFYLGAKVNFWSEYRQNAAALALRAMVKLPTGDVDAGTTTEKPDFSIDFLASKETVSRVDIAAYGGFELRGDPDDIDVPGGALRWGAGAGFPSRSPLRFTLEANGLLLTDDAAAITAGGITAVDGSRAAIVSDTENLTRATAALTWQMPKGFFIGGGISWNVPMKDRDQYRTDEGATADWVDWQVRLGYHPGVRRYVPPPPPPLPAAAAPVQPNRPPTVRARCEPCTVEVGRTSTVTADAQDPDGDTLTYRWAAPAGTFQNPGDRQTVWTAPQQEGPVPVTVTVDDGKGGTASDTVRIDVVRPAPVVELNFEDVYFDFDRSTLRPEALRLLDDAVTRLQANPTRNIVIEGHTCNIGTAEYNLALGDRRAASVRAYLVSRGVAANRLETRSYGEEQPKYDNGREETRRLNRRAALTVRVQ